MGIEGSEEGEEVVAMVFEFAEAELALGQVLDSIVEVARVLGFLVVCKTILLISCHYFVN